MFSNFKVFKVHARRNFKDINTKRTAAKKLIYFKQKRATFMYTVYF